jgi:hypothetical protein
MKFVKAAIVALLITAAFASCKKDDVEAPFTIEGVWDGETGNGGQFAINVKPGGVLERLNYADAVVATGNWQLNGNTLTGDYYFPSSDTEVTFSAEINSNQRTLSGTWSNNGGEVGTMTASKE